MTIIDKYFTSKRKLKNQVRDYKMHTALLTSALRDEGSQARTQYNIKVEGEKAHRQHALDLESNSKLQLRVWELENELRKKKSKPTPPIPTLRAIRTDRVDAMVSLDTGIASGVHAVELVLQGGHKVSTIMDAKDIERYVNKIREKSQ